MADRAELHLQRNCEAIAVPSGQLILLQRGETVQIEQHLGGHYTVRVAGNLARIDETDADALGLIGAVIGATASGPEAKAEPFSPEAVWRVLRTCYDPEIPVDIVELGLVYRCEILPAADGGQRIELDMTLTAPGCGMGLVMVTDVKRKLLRLPQVSEVEVQLVFEPPWDASRMSEVARLKLGLL